MIGLPQTIMKDRPTWESVNDAFYKLIVQPCAEVQFEAL